MFFPKLSRRKEEEYYSNRGGFYANYRDNYGKIAEDCLHRCVYCDITVEEHGGDEMHLDHFRPQNHFDTLTTHPHNLYLACPKCNGLKKDDWPAAIDITAPTFLGASGYIDRFAVDVQDFLSVGSDGKIVPKMHPLAYMIKKLHLNRTSRANVRRKRYIELRKTELLRETLETMKKIADDRLSGKLTEYEANGKYEEVRLVLERIQLI